MRHTWKKWVGCLLAAIMLCTSIDHTALAAELEEAEEGIIEVKENAEEVPGEEVSVEDASVEDVSEGDVFVGEDSVEHFQAGEEDAYVLMGASGTSATSGKLGTKKGISWTYDKNSKTLTVTGEDELCGIEVQPSAGTFYIKSPFRSICDSKSVNKIIFQNCKLYGKADYLFYLLEDITEIDCSGLDTSEVTDMSYMFSLCYSLVNLDVSKFNTVNVINMDYMFNFGSTNVTTLDISSFDTRNVTSMADMFCACSGLKNLDLSNFNTGRVINMDAMFSNCSNLENLNISNFDTSNVTNMKGMFEYCSKLKSLDIGMFDTGRTGNMTSMFNGCSSLESLNLSSFDTGNVTADNTYWMLRDCSSLETLRTPKTMGQGEIELPTSFCDEAGRKYTRLTTDSAGKVLKRSDDIKYYTINFDGNGATGGSMFAMEKIDCEESVTLPVNKFTRPGYGFMGWNTAADGSGIQYTDCAVVQKLADANGVTVVLYAQWKEGCYSITYRISDGSNNPDNPDSYDENTPTITLKDPTRPGYTFVAWYSDSKWKKKASEIPQGSKSDMVFYAKWKANKYNVSFDGNGAAGGKMSELKNRTYGKSFKLGANNFKKSGYTFRGWNTEADGSGTSYKNKASVKNLSAEAGGTAVLYAQWEPVKYKITYKLGGGSNAGGNPLSYNALTPAITLMEPSKTGYTFAGWYSDSKYRKAVTEIPQGSKGNKTLYAKWTANKYTVKFDGNGATSGEMAELADRVYGKSYTLKKNPFKKDGAVFKGWTLTQDGSGKLYKNKAKIKNLCAEAGGTVTLYAQWK